MSRKCINCTFTFFLLFQIEYIWQRKHLLNCLFGCIHASSCFGCLCSQYKIICQTYAVTKQDQPCIAIKMFNNVPTTYQLFFPLDIHPPLSFLGPLNKSHFFDVVSMLLISSCMIWLVIHGDFLELKFFFFCVSGQKKATDLYLHLKFH